MSLNQLRDNKGSHVHKRRVGRGIGSGKGKTCGRGQKGQKSRSGVSLNGFEGGQLPLYQRMPKRGFRNIFKKHYDILNLSDLEAAFKKGRLNEGEKVTSAVLKEKGIISHKKSDGVRILGDGEIAHPVQLEVAGVSASAKKAIEKAGGSVTILEKKA